MPTMATAISLDDAEAELKIHLQSNGLQ
jgi:hypothetical protein